MQSKRKLLPVFLVGVLIGVALGVEVVHFAESQVCPQTYCIDQSSVIAVSDRGFFPAVHEALQDARESIHIVAFELKYYPEYPDSSQNIIVEDLIEAHTRGVDVKVVMDEYASENSAFEYLGENGIPVKYDSRDVTTHAKLVIIDGEKVILGSTNFSYYGLEKNNEVDVIIMAEHIADYFEEYFQGLWNKQ